MSPRDPFAPWDEESSPGLSASSGSSDPFRPWSGPEYLTPFEQLDQERVRKTREQLLSIGVDPNLAATIGDAGLLGMTRYYQLTEGPKQNDAIQAGLEQPYDPAEPTPGPWGAGADMLRQLPAGGVEGLSNIMFGMPQGILRAAAETYDEDALLASPQGKEWLTNWANAYGEANRALSGEAQEIAPPPTDLLGKAARAAGPSAAIMLPFAAGPGVGIPSAYAQVFADEINTAYDRGEEITPKRVGIASLSSALQSFIEVAGGPERALAEGLARAGGAIPFLKSLGKMAVGEGLEEGAQSAVNLAGRFAAGEFEGQDPVKVVADWLPSVGEEMAIGAILGGVMGGPVQAAAELQAADEQKAIDDATRQIDASFQEAIRAAYGPEGIPGAGSAPLVQAGEAAPDPNLPLEVSEAAAPAPVPVADPFRPWTDEAVQPQDPPLQGELEATGTENLLSEPLRGPQTAAVPEAAGASSEAPIAAEAPTEAAAGVESGTQGELFTPEGEAAPEPPITLANFRQRLVDAGRPDEEVRRNVDLVERFSARQGVSPDEFLASAVADLRTNRTQEEMRAGPPGLERATPKVSESTSVPLWYSKLHRAVIDKMPRRQDASELISMLKKAGVKDEEIDYSGVRNLSGMVDRDDVIRTIEENGVEVSESELGEKRASLDWQEVDSGGEKIYRALPGALEEDEEAVWEIRPDRFRGGVGYRATRITFGASGQGREGQVLYGEDLNDTKEAVELFEGSDGEEGAQYGEYTLPGGDNYRELLLTLGRKPGEQAFRSGHFNESNVLAHARLKDRTDVDGKKVLFVEEIQSDWHQSGREKGYQGSSEVEELRVARDAAIERHVKAVKALEEARKESSRLYHEILANELGFKSAESRPGRDVLEANHEASLREVDRLEEEADQAHREVMRLREVKNAVPDAPFKSNWHELVFKRLMRYAAENGYDRIAWTTGQQQAERYDLSKEVGAVAYNRGNLVVHDLQGNESMRRTGLTEADLPDYIGKELTEKLLGSEPQDGGWRQLDGLDLQVGGEGMQHFYDKMLPSTAKKLGKKYGVRPIDTMIETGSYPTSSARRRESVHALDVVPEMAEAQPLFRKDGRFVHGRVVFDPKVQGKAVIDIAEGADSQAVAEELVHTFRRNLATEDLAEAERLLGVKDGDWTVEKEELFAKKTLGALENQRITGFWRKMANLFRQWAESVREFVTGEKREGAVGRGFQKFVDTYLGKGEGQYPAVAKSRAAGEGTAGRGEGTLERRTFRSTKSGVPKEGLKGFMKEWFTYEGVRSSKAVEIIEDSYQKRDAAHLAALGEAKALIQAVSSMPEEQQVEAWGQVADYLATSATDALQDLPKPVRALAKRFRDKTDKMSTEIANRPGMVSDTLASVILGQAAELSDETGIGRYQTRTFRAFRDENWHEQIKQTPLWNALVPKVKAVLIDNAREHLIAAYGAKEGRKGLSPDEIEAVMDFIVGTTPNLKSGGFVTPPLKRGEADLGKRYFEEDVERHRRAVHDVEGWMDSTLLQARNEMTSPRGQGIGTILTGIYKRRKDIPEAIRQLLGEDTNAAIRYLHTMEALTRNLANHEMYELLLDNGLAEGWASISPRAGFVRFPGVESRNPMAGTEGRPIYVHKKVAEALTDRETSGQAEVIRTISGLVKMGLTVGSIQTQSRNILSNVVFMLGAGALTSPKYLKAAAGVLWKGVSGRGAGGKKEALDAVERLREDVFMGASDEEIHGALVRMRELGVTGTSIDVRDVHYFLRGLADDLDPDLQFTDWKKRAASKSWSWVKSGARKATDLYQLGDDMFKVARFMQEMSRLQYHSPELVKNNRAEAEKRAASIVKDTMPNYDRLSKFMRALKRNRLFGPFISFVAEVPRVTLNQFLQAKHEIREGLADGNHKMVATGAHRLASQAFAIGFLPGIAAAIARALFGMDDDEQTAEDKAALRALVPDFMQNGQPIFLRRDDGTFFVFDWGFMDPYAVIKRPFFGAVRNGALGLGEELSDIYLGEELIVAPAIDIIRNRKRSGGQVFPEGGSVGANLAIASGHLFAAAIPGIGNTLSRNVRAWAGTETDWGRKYDPWAEAIAVLGPRVMRIGAKEALGWEARAYMRRVQSAREGERRGKPKEAENENWLATLVYAADNALKVPQAISGEAAFVTAARDLSRAIAGARTAGLGDKEIIAALKEARLPKDDLSAAFKSADELAAAAKQRSVRRSRSYSRRGARR